MKRKSVFLIIGLCFSISIGSRASTNPGQQQIDQWINNEVGFKQNFGQVKDFNGKPVQDVLYRASLQDYSLFITKSGVSVVMYQQEKYNAKVISPEPLKEMQNPEIRFARYDLNLVNGIIDKNKIILGQPLQGVTNYYLGDTKATNVKAYQIITLKDVYPGIDWVWHFDGEMHHEFVVQPEADPNLIKLAVKWADVDIEDNGKTISYTTPLGTITDGPLYAYEKAGKNEVNIRYSKLENNQISFNITDYDKDKVLVIDPPLALQWATYYGGGEAERGMAITTDVSGNIFITGNTTSPDFPTQDPGGGAYFDGTHNIDPDVFMLKFTDGGVLEWATYYGGANHDYGESIITDALGNVFVTGQTNSPDLPMQDPGGGAYFDESTNGQSDAFILKFTNNGTLEWATYIGGNMSDTGYSIVTDDSGNVFVTGKTRSTNFPTLNPGGDAYFNGTPNGNYDIFILKFTGNGVHLWGTYYGGESLDWGESITLDESGNLYIIGRTESTELPTQDPGSGAYFDDTHNGLTDSFILKFLVNGALQWATYYGGSEEDWMHEVITDASGNLYITGETLSTNLPTLDQGNGAYFDGTNNGGNDAFILKFTSSGVPTWATYYGGASIDYGTSITIDENENLFVLGGTMSTEFPTQDPGDGTYFDGTFHGLFDMFMLEFNNNGIRQWATYYGGDNYDFTESMTLDNFGNMYITGSTLSADFPTLDPENGAYFDGSYNSPDFHDIIILKFNNEITNIEDGESLVFDKVVVYPNPSQGLVNVSLGDLKGVTITVFDNIGRRVYHETNINAPEFHFNMEETAGIYFVEINANNKSQRFKLIIN